MKLHVFIIVIALTLIACTNSKKGLSVAEGKIVSYTAFKSEYIDARNIDVWLPKSYSLGKKHPVLYMHDGQMLFDASQTWNGQEWGVDEVLTKLKNDIHPLPIVVGIWNNPSTRHADFAPQKALEQYATPLLDSLIEHTKRGNEKLFNRLPRADDYLKFLVEEVKPHIDKTFNTNPNSSHTFVVGSSMGGLISLYALMEYPEVFGGAGCLSTHWTVEFYLKDNPFPGAIAAYVRNNSQSLRGKKLYMDRGTKTLDSIYAEAQKKIDDILSKATIEGLIWKSKVFEGAEHTENDWNKRLDVPLGFLFEKN